jgi:hypothetical protein
MLDRLVAWLVPPPADDQVGRMRWAGRLLALFLIPSFALFTAAAWAIDGEVPWLQVYVLGTLVISVLAITHAARVVERAAADREADRSPSRSDTATSIVISLVMAVGFTVAAYVVAGPVLAAITGGGMVLLAIVGAVVGWAKRGG